MFARLSCCPRHGMLCFVLCVFKLYNVSQMVGGDIGGACPVSWGLLIMVAPNMHEEQPWAAPNMHEEQPWAAGGGGVGGGGGEGWE